MDKRWEKLGRAVERPAHHQQQGKGDRFEKKNVRLPDVYVFDTFYKDSGFLKDELFYTNPPEIAKLFEEAEYTRSSFRNTFNAFQQFAYNLKVRDDSMPFEKAKEEFGKFYTQSVVYQNKRTDSPEKKVMPDVVFDFIDKHRIVALKSREEMLGLFQYLTSVYCYFEGKDR